MNSLDKMEDYDRLKQERNELAAQVEVMRDALASVESSDALYDYTIECKISSALSITPSSALREIKARSATDAMERLKQVFLDYESDEIFIVSAIDHIEIELAAAKRKGEPT